MKVVAAAALVVLFGAGIAATGEAQDAARGYAEGLAQAASKEFGDILERQRLAQAHGSKSDAGAALRQGDLGAGPPLSWFRRSGREFQSLMQMLAGQPPSPQWDPVADSEKKAALQKADAARIQPPSPAAAEPATPADANKAAGGGKEQSDRIANAKAAESALPGMAEAKTADEAKKTAEAKRAAKAARASEAKQVADLRAAEEAKRPANAKATADATKAKQAAAAKAAGDMKATGTQAAIDPARAVETRRAADAKATLEAAMPAEGKDDAAWSAAGDKQSTAPAKMAKKQAAEPKRLAQVEAQDKTAQPTAGGRREAVAATSCRAAGEAIRAPGWYIVQKGDTLSAIAWRHYGSARRYRRIQAANRRSIRNVHRIHPCQRIYLPGAARRR